MRYVTRDKRNSGRHTEITIEVVTDLDVFALRSDYYANTMSIQAVILI
jgi:hypothetical protein